MQPESAVFELLVQPTQTGIVALKNASLYVLSYGRTAACVGMSLKSLLVIILLGELLEAVEGGGGGRICYRGLGTAQKQRRY